MQIPVATQSKVWVFGRLVVGLRVRIPLRAWMFVFYVYMLFFPV
jgi:hypothetical protein